MGLDSHENMENDDQNGHLGDQMGEQIEHMES